VNIQEFSSHFEHACHEVQKVLLGQEDIVEQVLIALLARGHVLIEGVPGLGKTLLVRTLGHVLGCTFKRIQFTPDLMPSDVTGGNIFNQRDNEFVFMRGPVFTELLLADEINRAPAKTQASLLEAMQDHSVTIDGTTHPLPAPFFVIATQNPIESQGTYPLPEAQLDRFLLKLQVQHPSPQVEQQVLRNYLSGFDPTKLERVGVERVLGNREILEMQAAVGQVRVAEEIVAYITDIVTRTRAHSAVYLGASPRASIGLLSTSRTRALASGRDFVIPDDIKTFAGSVLRHRLLLQPDAELEGITSDDVIESILKEAPVPKTVA
jgi:MoxR-like ATPase